MEHLKCEECGRNITAGSKRCSYCGCPIEVMFDSTSSANTCPKCGKSVGKGMNYCPHCGAKQNIRPESTPLPDAIAANLNKTTRKSSSTEKQKNKASTDNLDVPMPSKPKIGKGIIIYTVILFVFILWLVSIGGLGVFLEAEVGSGIIVLSSPIIFYAIAYIAVLNNYKLAQTDYPKYVMKVKANKARQEAEKARKKATLEAEYNAAVLSQKRSEPWAVRYSTSPCPHCGHYKVRHAKWEDKSMSVAFWGMASSTIGKNYKCEHCGRMW